MLKYLPMSLLGFDTSSFMPHGHCVLWREDILWPMVASDTLIFLSYSAIPFGLFYFYRNRLDLSPKVKRILILFVLFIQLCGLTHIIGAYNYWNADYYTELLVKMATALVSVVTAIIFLKNVPALLGLPSPVEFEEANRKLKELNQNLEDEVKKQISLIKEEKNFLSALLEGINDGIAEITPIKDEQGEIIDFSMKPLNEKLMEQAGLTRSELTVDSMKSTFPDFYKERFEKYLRIYKTGITEVYDPSSLRLNGRVFRAVYTKNHHNDTLLLFLANVTEREELKLTSISNSRLSALGELAGGIAHEINNPLQIIDGAARMVKRQVTELPAEADESLEMIRTTVKRVSKIITNLKRLSRNEVDTIKGLDIQTFLGDVKEFVAQKIKNRGIILKETYREQPNKTINANEVALSQILINILNNAIDELDEVLKDDSSFSPEIEINVITSNNLDIIEVSDNGRGIPKKNLEDIFNPLFTSKEVGKGTGLGLTLSRNLAHQMGADIKILQDGKTRFQIIFDRNRTNEDFAS